jgi:hypothetical protein
MQVLQYPNLRSSSHNPTVFGDRSAKEFVLIPPVYLDLDRLAHLRDRRRPYIVVAVAVVRVVNPELQVLDPPLEARFRRVPVRPPPHVLVPLSRHAHELGHITMCRMAWPTRFLDSDFCKCNNRKWTIYASSTLKVANTNKIPLSAKYCEDPPNKASSFKQRKQDLHRQHATCTSIQYFSCTNCYLDIVERLSNTYTN